MRDLANLDFHHPYTPYDVQNQFMRTVYHVLAKGKGQIGILESPTGTVSMKYFAKTTMEAPVIGQYSSSFHSGFCFYLIRVCYFWFALYRPFPQCDVLNSSASGTETDEYG